MTDPHHAGSTDAASLEAGREMYRLATELFPICRSITGNGVRQTLARLRQEMPGLQFHEVPSGTPCFDWEVPLEWNINDAYLVGPDGEKLCDFKVSNLHVVGYSTPQDREIGLDELQDHLFSVPELPDAVPYISSAYHPFWGFCLSQNQRAKLKPGTYKVKIDSTLKAGHLTYGELVIPGRVADEIFLSTYVCHPSLANNELSGPVLATALAKWLFKKPDRHFTYRIVFVPETIGAIVYTSRNLESLKARTYAGYQITCVGDDRCYSFVPSRAGGTPADRAALHVLRHHVKDFKHYSYLDRGSDERQYCSPGVDLPLASITRSKYRTYPEYHTSLDNLDLISPEALAGTYAVYTRVLELLDRNRTYAKTCFGEPQLARRGLYPTVSKVENYGSIADMMNFIAYSDGKTDLIQICDTIGADAFRLLPTIEKLVATDVLKAIQ